MFKDIGEVVGIDSKDVSRLAASVDMRITWVIATNTIQVSVDGLVLTSSDDELFSKTLSAHMHVPS
jgi:hypothetical protein